MSGTRELRWPHEETVYLTLDLECDFGTALSENRYGALAYTDELVSLIERFDVPLTCFVQTEVFDVNPDAVEALRESDVPVSFHPHSHTHAPREEANVQEEVETSSRRYRDYFGSEPVGYRFPNGNVRPSDYETLREFGYGFDASVFPSWRPGHFDNRTASTVPEYLLAFDIMELPFTVVSETIRVPTALSYCRLLGRPFSWFLGRYGPSTMVFNVHLHDFANPESFRELSPMYRLVYRRNSDGFELFERLLRRVAESGYEFRLLDEAYEELVG